MGRFYKMQYKIAIPSYKRHKLLRKKTLAFLEYHEINPKNIHIFVANKKEYNIYYNEFGKKYNIIIGKIGLYNNRNIITKYFPIGEYILNMDDDVEDILELNKPGELKSIKSLNEFCEAAFLLCKEKKIFLWGVYAVQNPFFMKRIIKIGLNHIVGSFWGNINRHDPSLKITLRVKEDYERSIKYYEKDGRVLRFNYVTVKTKYYNSDEGGLSKIRTPEIAKKEVEKLITSYPNYVRIAKYRNGYPEIIIKDTMK